MKSGLEQEYTFIVIMDAEYGINLAEYPFCMNMLIPWIDKSTAPIDNISIILLLMQDINNASILVISDIPKFMHMEGFSF